MSSVSFFNLVALPGGTGSMRADYVLATTDTSDSAQAPWGSLVKFTLAQQYRTENTAVTVSTPLPDIAQTWNAGGVTFTAVRLNVTNTASAAGSLLFDMQVGGTSQWKVNKAGATTQTGGLFATGAALTGTIFITETNPRIVLTDTAGSANNTKFDIIGSAGAPVFQLVNDADSVGAAWLAVTRSLNVATTVSVIATTTSISADLTVGETITTAALGISGATPRLYWVDSSGSADNRHYDIIPSANVLYFRLLNDIETVGGTWLSVSRSLNIATLVALTATATTISGTLGVSGLTTISDGTPAFLAPTGLTVAFSSTNALTGHDAATVINKQTVATVATAVGFAGAAESSNTSGTVAQIEGVTGQARVTGAGGTTTRAVAVQGGGAVTNGTATTFSCFTAGNPGVSGGGVITTLIGLEVGDITVGGTNYAIKTGVGNVFFGDAVNIGTPQINFGNSTYGLIAAYHGGITVSGQPLIGAEFIQSTAFSGTVVAMEGLARATHTSGTITSMTGGAFNSFCSGAGGTITRAGGIGCGGQIDGATVTTFVCMNAGTPGMTGGSIGTLIGVEVGNMALGSVNYAIKTGAGLVSFGDRTIIISDVASAVGKLVVSDGTTFPFSAPALTLGILQSVTNPNASGTWWANNFSVTQAVATSGTTLATSSTATATHTTGTVAQLGALGGTVYVTGSGGTVTNAYGVTAQGQVGTGATVTNMFCLSIGGIVNTGTITNAYGIFVNAITAGATLNYAIKTKGGRVGFESLPTSAAGLATGDIWNNLGILNVA